MDWNVIIPAILTALTALVGSAITSFYISRSQAKKTNAEANKISQEENRTDFNTLLTEYRNFRKEVQEDLNRYKLAYENSLKSLSDKEGVIDGLKDDLNRLKWDLERRIEEVAKQQKHIAAQDLEMNSMRDRIKVLEDQLSKYKKNETNTPV